jgi:N-acetyl-alpha-D-muramate 1-phosphate uridylyltransferase
MEAMIFAAGRGSRLGPIGEQVPKALLEVGGRTMLDHTLRALVAAGASHVVVNVHHHADAIARFLATHDFGVEVELSHEPDHPLETGGGLLHARALFRGGTIVLHNVDVITDAPLRDIVAAHEASGALATLCVQERETARYLLFDDDGLFGREDRRHDLRFECRPPRGAVRRFAFAGIHVCSARLLERITERGVFPIMDTYLRLAAEGERVAPWPLAGGRWLEIGNAGRLAAARAVMGGEAG